MPCMKNLLELPRADFSRQTGWARMTSGGKKRRVVICFQCGVIQYNNPARRHSSTAQLPILACNLIVVISIDINHIPLLLQNEILRSGRSRELAAEFWHRQIKASMILPNVLKVIHLFLVGAYSV